MFIFRRRYFLNPRSTGHTSHVLAEVESSRDGKYPWGTNMLTIADCRRSIELEFFLGNAAARKHSIYKIDLLISVLCAFREALKREIALIEQPKRRGPRRTKT
jgi:hypothetical protein